eukprot:8243438-Pyramimonas_sp.AAC.1
MPQRTRLEATRAPFRCQTSPREACAGQARGRDAPLERLLGGESRGPAERAANKKKQEDTPGDPEEEEADRDGITPPMA